MRIISNIIAVVWFIFALLWSIVYLPLVIYAIIDGYRVVLVSGFSGSSVGFTMLILFSIVHGLTLWIPVLRKCYNKLPWLYPYMVIGIMNVFNLSIGEKLLNFGYEKQNTTRHIVFLIITIIQLLVGRLLMCWFLKKYPMRMERKDYE